MSFEREPRVGGAPLIAHQPPPGIGPGKHSLTEALGDGGASHAKQRPKQDGGDGGDGAPAVAAVDHAQGAQQLDSPAPAPGVTPAVKPPPTGPAWTSGKHVTPTFTVSESVAARSNTASSKTTTDTPTFTGHAALDGLHWRYQLDSVSGTGQIKLVYYTADHYPAPTPTDDSGALSNVTAANWKSMVADLKAHRTGMGGAWSAYRAEDLHEHYHWEVEWQGQIKKALTKLETDIESISASAATFSTVAEAERELRPKIDAAFAAAMRAARAAYDALGDSPGDPPYVAQAPAIDALVTRIEAHAKTEKWP
jgi:hypothetical protein